MHPANVALLLMLAVIAAAMVGGRRAGVLAALVAALSFNFFSTEPVHTLRISDAGDVLSFVLLLVGGLAVGQLAHVAAERGRRAEHHRLGIRRLHELAELVANGASDEVLVDRATRYLVDELLLEDCRFEWGDRADAPPDLAHRAVLEGDLRHAPGGFELPRDGLSLPVVGPDGRTVGRFRLQPRPGRGPSLVDRQLAVLVSDLVAPSLSAGRH